MSQTRLIFGVFIILIGLSVLIDLPVLKILFALFVVWLGMRVIVGREGGFIDFREKTEAHEDEIKRVLVFTGINKKFVSSDFKGGEIVAVFGGGDIDLSDVKTKQKELTLELTAVFGGLKVKLPSSWSIKSEGVGILGGYDNKTQLKGRKTVDATIKGAAIFGGVEIVS